MITVAINLAVFTDIHAAVIVAVVAAVKVAIDVAVVAYVVYSSIFLAPFDVVSRIFNSLFLAADILRRACVSPLMILYCNTSK